MLFDAPLPLDGLLPLDALLLLDAMDALPCLMLCCRLRTGLAVWNVGHEARGASTASWACAVCPR